MTKKKYNLAFFSSHPIHHQIGLLKKLDNNNNINLSIYFGSKFGIEEGLDKTFGKKVKWYDKSILEGLDYKFLKNHSFKSEIGGFWSVVNFSILKELYKNNYDGLIVPGWHYFSFWIAFISSIITNTPLIIRGENPLNQELVKNKFKIILKKILLGNFLFKITSSFLYIGDQNKKFYRYYGVREEKLFFTPYSVDNDRFQKENKKIGSKREEFRSNFGINKNDKVVLFLGKLINKKNPMDLLKAYEKVQDNSKEKSHLIFVGDGPLRNDLENYIKLNNIKNVYFEGFKHQPEIPKYYIMSDIFVLPSGIGETWGLVVNEAMNFSLPVIVSNVPGSGYDLVKEGENGYKFPVGDIGELSKKLGNLISNSEKRKKFGSKSFNIIKSYSYKENVKGILKALKNIK